MPTTCQASVVVVGAGWPSRRVLELAICSAEVLLDRDLYTTFQPCSARLWTARSATYPRTH
jgi:hypothetical protein